MTDICLGGGEKVYCPWDMINYIFDAMDDPEKMPLNNRANTSSNLTIRSLVSQPEYFVNRKLEILLNGGVIRQDITEGLTYRRLYASEKNLWSVMVMTGYLTKTESHAFVAGIFAGAVYETEFNREHEPGRTDIVMIDAPGKKVMIIEAKKSQREGYGKRLQESAGADPNEKICRGVPAGLQGNIVLRDSILSEKISDQTIGEQRFQYD